MKAFLLICFGCGLLSITVYAQDTVRSAKPNPALKIQLVEVSCGMCQFGLGGNDCKLAVRIKNKAYYVEGAGIDDFGDAHADDGFCNAIRKAKVQGKVEGNSFKVTWLQPLPAKQHKESKTKNTQ
jgi:Family of unknown function (DUF6370)